MPEARVLDQHEQSAATADPRRLAILRMLMAEPATITQIGVRIGKHPAWVRHHAQVLLAPRLVMLAPHRKRHSLGRLAGYDASCTGRRARCA